MEPRPDGVFPFGFQILVCTGGRCNAEGEGLAIRNGLKARNKELGLERRVRVCSVSCLDLCDFGPNLVVWPGGRTHGRQTLQSARELYASCLAGLPPTPSPETF